MKLPLGFGRLDFGDWLYGLGAAFIGGGASAVTSGITLNLLDPSDFNLQTGKLWVTMAAFFVVNGTMSAMAFLRTKPLPDIVVTTTTETTSPAKASGPKVVTTVETVEQVPAQPIIIAAPLPIKTRPEGD